MSDLAAIAEAYAAHGWHVLPLTPGGKIPATKRGLHDATDDVEHVRQWWRERPEANIGISCGPSGLAVVDVDDPAGLAQIADGLPPTLTASTSRPGGQHIYYTGAAPNSVGKIAPGVDTRGDGGYVVAPGSVVNGVRYGWTNHVAPAPLPQWISDALAPKNHSAEERISTATPEPDGWGVGDRWGRQVLDGEVAKVRATSPTSHNRNETLYNAAFKVAGGVKGGHLDEAVAQAALTAAGRMTALPDDEIARAIRQGFDRAEARHPQGDLLAPITNVTSQASPVTPSRPSGGFLTLDDLAAVKPVSWLVRDVLPEGITVLYGRGGVGKSFLALDLSLALAADDRWVLYAVGEGLAGLPPRVGAWRDAHPHADPGLRFMLAADTEQGVAFPGLLHADSVERFRRDLAALPHRPDLIVIDTWARALGGDENDTASVSRAVAVLDRLRAEHGCSILVIHHESAQGRARGNTALPNAADAMWHLKEADGDELGVDLLMWCDKARNFERPKQPRKYSLTPWGPSAVVAPSAAGEFARRVPR
ncbi:MAG: bifunctional DNA primase/polymerase [Nitriliruptorales bacterium]